MEKVGVVLEGGAMRGMYTNGVLDVFLEHNFVADSVIGVSAGALFGINYPSKQPKRALRYNLKYANDKHYLGWYSFFTSGNMVNTEFAYSLIPFKLDVFDNQTFKESPIKFYATITNVDTGKAEYVRITDPVAQVDTLRAGGAMPFVSQIVELNGHGYLDGGIADSIPIEECLRMGYKKIIVVLTQVKEYRKKPQAEWLIKSFYFRHPQLAEALLNRWKNYNATLDLIEKLEAEGKIFVVRPTKDLHLARIERDPEKLQAMYDLGVENMSSAWNAFQQYLAA